MTVVRQAKALLYAERLPPFLVMGVQVLVEIRDQGFFIRADALRER